MLILGLGSNIYPREFYLEQAISLLIKEKVIEPSKLTISTIFKTKAIQKNTNNDYFDLNFLNLVLVYDSQDLLDAFIILNKIKKIETLLGRVYRGLWAPREIDIDIIFYNDKKIDTAELTIPHKEFLNRSFVILPLLEILPDFTINKNGEKLALKLFVNSDWNDIVISKIDRDFKSLSIIN